MLFNSDHSAGRTPVRELKWTRLRKKDTKQIQAPVVLGDSK
jgi:hypothetical protein